MKHRFVDEGLRYSSRGISRVVNAMQERDIDLPILVLHVNGRIDQMHRQVEAWDGDYIVVQYVLRSAQKPHTSSWLPLWKDAKLVWSYYDLPALCAEDGVEADFPFYRSPLGIEDVFRRKAAPSRPQWMVATHGDYITQSTRECIIAAETNDGRVIHVGPQFRRDSVDFVDGVPDDTLAAIYRTCGYVSGMRRTEGFELPAAEGLASGARPLLFDRPHYRHWYGDHAIYLQETGRDQVVEQLEAVFGGKQKPVTAAESKWAAEFFDWDKIIQGLHDHL